MKQFWEDLQKLGYKIHNKQVLQELELPLKISKETLEINKCMEYALILRWFRKKSFICYVTNDLSDNLNDEIYVYIISKGYGNLIDRSEEYETYEEAEFNLIKELIKIIK